MIQCQNCSFLWAHYVIFTNSFILILSCHPLHVSLKKLRSHTSTTHIELDLQHTGNLKKKKKFKWPQVIQTNFNLKLRKFKTCGPQRCFVTGELVSSSSNFISHLAYPKSPFFFPQTDPWTSVYYILCVFTSQNPYTHLITANKTGDINILPTFFFTKIKPNYAALKVKLSIVSCYLQRLLSSWLIQSWYYIHIAPCNSNFSSLFDL